MGKLSNSLSSISILTEANDDLFDIDKEVDAQIKRVNNRLERKKAQEEEQTNPENIQDQELNKNEEGEDNVQEIEEMDQETETENNIQSNNTKTEEVSPSGIEEQDQTSSQDDNYEYMDNDIPDNYEPKQTIPELRILSTLSDSEYALCNIKILEKFKELRNVTESSINNIIMNITTRNSRQVQIVDMVHQNLHEMIIDIDNYILYRNNDIYEENVTAYLTYLKRYDIAMKLIKNIVDENIKSNNSN